MKHLLIAFVRLWRALISPLYGDVCKFHPSCSEYGLKSLQTHGAVRGSWLIVRRLVRCHPWSLGGYDPVPGTPEAIAWARQQAAEGANSAPAADAAAAPTARPADSAGQPETHLEVHI